MYLAFWRALAPCALNSCHAFEETRYASKKGKRETCTLARKLEFEHMMW